MKDRVFIGGYTLLLLAILAVTISSCFSHWERLVSLNENGEERQAIVTGVLSKKGAFPYNKLYTIQLDEDYFKIQTLLTMKYNLGQTVNVVMDKVDTTNSILGSKKDSPLDYFFELEGAFLVVFLLFSSIIAIFGFLKTVVFLTIGAKRP